MDAGQMVNRIVALTEVIERLEAIVERKLDPTRETTMRETIKDFRRERADLKEVDEKQRVELLVTMVRLRERLAVLVEQHPVTMAGMVVTVQQMDQKIGELREEVISTYSPF